MEDLRCRRPECPRCSRLGKLVAKVGIPPSLKRPTGIVLELVCPYNKRKKVLFRI